MNTATTAPITKPCPSCGEPTPQVPGLGITLHCDDCTEKIEAERNAHEIERVNARREKHWREICPGGYRETDATDPRLNQIALESARDWVRNHKAGCTRGLSLIGRSGLGKTRIAYLALKACHDSGERVFAIRAKELAAAAVRAAGGGNANSRQQDEATQTLRACISADVLLLDDLGKGSATPRVIESIEDLIEDRTANKRPIIWTSNAGGDWLEEFFGPDSGPPIVRRLSEFCESPELPRE